MKKVTLSNLARGRRQLISITNNLLIYDKQIKLTAKKEPMWNGELEICVTMWWADENHVSDTTTWRCQEHNRDRMATFETHQKYKSIWNDNKMQYFMRLQKHVIRINTNWFLSVLHVQVDPFRLKLQSCHYGISQCRDKSVHAMRLWVNPRHQTPQGQSIRKIESPLQNKIHKALLMIDSRLSKAMGRPDTKI